MLDASDPFSTETVRGLEDAVHERGSAVILCSTDGSPDREARYLRWLEEQRVQGIVITPATRSIRHLETLSARGTLVVLLDRRSRRASCAPSRSTTLAAASSRRATFRPRAPPHRLHQRTAAPVAVRRAAAGNAAGRRRAQV